MICPKHSALCLILGAITPSATASGPGAASGVLEVPRAAEASFKFKVSAGRHGCRDTPVYADVDLAVLPGFRVRVVAGERQTPGQLEDLGGGIARIWWIVDRIEAGKSIDYEIEVGLVERDKTHPPFRWVPSNAGGLTSNTLVHGERKLLQYMHTKFAADNIELTKKPYHHVFAPDGSRLITKGHGGLYPHHRGVYFGYNKCQVDGQSYDTWHARKGEHQVHVEEIRRIEGPVCGGHVVRIHWNDRAGKTFAVETRRLVMFRQAAGHHLIEFQSHLEATDGPVGLRGDPQHAGVQFRAAQFVADHQKKTRFLRPSKWKGLPEDKQVNYPGNREHKDMPWNAARFEIEGKPFTVAYLSHPKNPEGAQTSERLYGRFGEFIPFDLREGRPLDLTYRWWVASSHDVTRGDVDGRYHAMADPPRVEVIE